MRRPLSGTLLKTPTDFTMGSGRLFDDSSLVAQTRSDDSYYRGDFAMASETLFADSSPVDWSDDSYYRVDFTKMSEMLDEDCSPVDRTPTMTPSIAEILPRCLKCW